MMVPVQPPAMAQAGQAGGPPQPTLCMVKPTDPADEKEVAVIANTTASCEAIGGKVASLQASAPPPPAATETPEQKS
jgi:hypothetical protein